MKMRTLLLVTAFVGGGVMSAAAQTTPAPNAGAGASGEVSAATHCKDASGQVKLKSAMSGSSAANSSATGSATTGSATGATGAGASPGMSGAASGNATGGPAGASSSANTSAAAANLPNC